MKTKLMTTIAVLLVVLASAFSVAPAQAVTEKVRKEYFYEEIVPGEMAIEGWMSWTYGETETPQGIRWHISGVAQFDLIDLITGAYVSQGASQYTFAQNGLGIDGEDIKIEENVVVNVPGKDMQGIEYRLKIIFIVQNGDVKVDVYFEPIPL